MDFGRVRLASRPAPAPFPRTRRTILPPSFTARTRRGGLPPCFPFLAQPLSSQHFLPFSFFRSNQVSNATPYRTLFSVFLSPTVFFFGLSICCSV